MAINCTGPQPRFSDTDAPVIQNLLRRYIVRPDELDMGIDVDDEFAVITREGCVSEHLHAIGPLLKGRLWETTAVPELRGQALQMARILLTEGAEADHSRFHVIEEDVIEYYI